MRSIAVLAILFACRPATIHEEPAAEPVDVKAAAPARADAATLACTIDYDAETFHHQLASDECLGDSRRACWTSCENDCSTCGTSCKDAACEAKCLAALGECKTKHCGVVHARCRTKLVTEWLANKCDATCAPYDACMTTCGSIGGAAAGTCIQKCLAMKTITCDPMKCGAMQNALERKTVDPKWKANDCDAVCARVWKCAESECGKTEWCGENIKMFGTCVKRTAGGNACGLRESFELCPEP